LTLEAGPRLVFENPGDLLLGRQRVNKVWINPIPTCRIGNQLEGRYIHRIGTDLAVADHPVARELESGDAVS
jgi:hypothetical protein